MAHFAEVDESNVVLRVIVVSNNDCLDLSGVEREQVGAAFCENNFGGRWLQTSYNASFRKNYAQIGGIYDPSEDAFLPIKPFPSWVLNKDTWCWDAPVPKPNAPYGYSFDWNEEKLSWVLIKQNEGS